MNLVRSLSLHEWRESSNKIVRQLLAIECLLNLLILNVHRLIFDLLLHLDCFVKGLLVLDH